MITINFKKIPFSPDNPSDIFFFCAQAFSSHFPFFLPFPLFLLFSHLHQNTPNTHLYCKPDICNLFALTHFVGWKVCKFATKIASQQKNVKLHTMCQIKYCVLNYTLCVKWHSVCVNLLPVCKITHYVWNKGRSQLFYGIKP